MRSPAGQRLEPRFATDIVRERLERKDDLGQEAYEAGGRIEVPQEAFLAVLELGSDGDDG